MKKSQLLKTISAIVLSLSIQFTACKNKSKQTTSDKDTSTVQTPSTPPVQISTDDSLTTGLKDATKDFPGVKATVDNGEVTLTGNIKRDQLPKLMQSIHALHPKKVNNNLKIE